MPKFIRDDFDKFHDYGCLIPERIIYFGSEFYEEDGGESGVDFASTSKLIKNILYLDRKDHKKPIYLHYSSPGGDWDRGVAVHDCIDGVKARVVMIGYGCVRSMGTVIMQACHKRFLTPHCRFMIHDGTMGDYGTSEDFWRSAKEGEVIRNQMHDIYLVRMLKKDPLITRAKIRKMCEHDYYMSGEKAVELGLADKVLKN